MLPLVASGFAAWMLVLAASGFAAELAASPGGLSFAELAPRARPSAELLEAEALLAEGQRVLALVGAGLADGVSLGLSAGPRHEEEADSTDVALEVEAPLLARSGARRDLADALAEAAPVLRAAARARARQRLAEAHIDAWLAASRVAVRLAEVATLERWRDAALRRVEAGAEAPFEAALVDADLAQARTALALARADQRRAWGALAALAEVPPEPVPLSAPTGVPDTSGEAGEAAVSAVPGTSGDGDAAELEERPPSLPLDRDLLRERFDRNALQRAVSWRATLRELVSRSEGSRERSRITLRSSLEREGDEEVARVGVAYRLSRVGETAAIESSIDAAAAGLRREVEIESAALAARFAAALDVMTALAAQAGPPDLDAALAAVELRLAEGKDRPSQALAIRRQLLAAREASLERLAALARARAELEALTTEVRP